MTDLNSLPDNSASVTKYSDTPPTWTGNQLYAGVSNLSDYIYWEDDGGIDELASSPWQYDEVDYEDVDDTGSDWDENCWGYIDSTPPGGTTTNALFCNLSYAYPPNDYMHGDEWSGFNQTIYVDRGTITRVRVTFRFYADWRINGLVTLFVEVNGYRQLFDAFNGGYSKNAWHAIEWEMYETEIGKYFHTPEDVVFKIGIDATTNGTWEGYGTLYHEVYFDDITIQLRGQAKPTQVQMTANSEPLVDEDYSKGGVYLNGSWPNPSEIDPNPISAEYTIGNSSSVIFTSELTQYVNRTRMTQTSEGSLGTDFLVKNETTGEFYARFFASKPDFHDEYNFTVNYPTDWDVIALYDPSPSEVLLLPGITESTGLLEVSAERAHDFPGMWEIDFESPNYITQVQIFQNTTASLGPTDWEECNYILAGNNLNITSRVEGTNIPSGTYAWLEFYFPNGTMWSEHSQIKEIIANRVAFDPIFFPGEEHHLYIAGSYQARIYWNNSFGLDLCNETGFHALNITVKHKSLIQPERTIITELLNGTSTKIKLDYQDNITYSPIKEAVVWFINFFGENQTMLEASPGYYIADLTGNVVGDPGFQNITIHANHPYFLEGIQNISVEVVQEMVLSSTVTPTITVQKDANATITLNYRTVGGNEGIAGATFIWDWSESAILHPVTGSPGTYTFDSNSTNLQINSIYDIRFNAKKIGYQNKTLDLHVKVIARNQYFHNTYFDDTNSTEYPAVEIPITKTVHFSTQVYDQLRQQRCDSGVTIHSGSENPTSMPKDGDDYVHTFDSLQMGIGIYYYTLRAQQTNYTDATLDVKVVVRQIATSTYTEDGKISYNIVSGSNFSLVLFVEDLDFGGYLQGCNVTYDWRYGKGVLTYNPVNQTYEGDVDEVPTGAWTITIQASKEGGYYSFQKLEITLVASDPVVIVDEFPWWLVIIAFLTLFAVILVVTAYELRFKFPLEVREIKDVTKEIKKGEKSVDDRKNPKFTVRAVPSSFAAAYIKANEGLQPVPIIDKSTMKVKSQRDLDREKEAKELEAQEKKSSKRFYSGQKKFEKALEVKDYITAASLLTELADIASAIGDPEMAQFVASKKDALKEVYDKWEKDLAALDDKFKKALSNEDYGYALEIAPQLVELATNLGKTEQKSNYLERVKQIENALEGKKSQLKLEEELFKKYLADNAFTKALEKTPILLSLAQKLKDKEKIEQYSKTQADIQHKIREANSQLKRYEQQFQKAFEAGDFEYAMEILPALMDLARQLDKPDKIKEYQEFKAKTENEIAQQRQEEELQQQSERAARESKTRKLAEREKEFQKAMNQRDFLKAQELIPTLLELANELNDSKRVRELEKAETQIKREQAKIDQDFRELEQDFKKALQSEDFQTCIDIAPDLLQLSTKLSNPQVQKQILKQKEQVEKQQADRVEEFGKLETKLEESMAVADFLAAIQLVPLLLELSSNLKDKRKNQRYEKVKEEVEQVLKAQTNDLEDQFDQTFNDQDYVKSIDIVTQLLTISTAVQDQAKIDEYTKLKAQLEQMQAEQESKEKKTKEKRANQLKMSEARFKACFDSGDYQRCLAILPGILELSSTLGDKDRIAKAKKLQSKIGNIVQQWENDLEKYEKEFQAASESQDFQKCVDLMPKILELSSQLKKQDLVIKYSKLQDNMGTVLQRLNLEHDQLEEEFQNYFADRNYTMCLELLPLLLNLASSLQNPELIERYTNLKDQLEGYIKQQEELLAREREKVQKIEKLKEQAFKYESSWKFDQAKKKYEEIKTIAEEISDESTLEFVQQKIAQIEKWEREIDDFDLHKWDIFPFKIINRRRFEFFELFPTRLAAERRMKALLREGMEKENALIVNIQRMKFKNRGPFNKDGRSFTIYRRRTLNDEMQF